MLDNVQNLLAGKKGLVTGIANNMSMAWSIAKLASTQGAKLALTYQGEALKKRIFPLAEEIGCDFVEQCDVTDEASMDNIFAKMNERWGKIDFIVHSLAFADKEELKGRYIDTSLNNFLNSMHISCYSLTALAKRAESLMKDGGSIITLTYHGSQKVMPNYNVMGIAKAALETSVKYIAADMGVNNIRVNAISPGPVKTLAAAGIGDFRNMLNNHAKTAPLRRNNNQEDVAGSAIYLLSDMSKGVTGEIHYVDCGYNIMGISSSADF